MNTASLKIDNRKDVLLLLLLSPGRSETKNETISGRTRFMKLVYLFYKELISKLPSFEDIGTNSQHEFKPYHFGPFSKDIFDDIQFLENADLVKEEAGGDLSMAELAESRLFLDEVLLERIETEESNEPYVEPAFRLSESGVTFAERLYVLLKPQERSALQQFKARYNNLPLSTLLRYVYAAYPESAVESRIRDLAWK